MTKENKPQKPVKKKSTNTTDFIDIAEIREYSIILKDSSLRSVIEVSSINFELKSRDEQTAIIQAFQGFLNSIDFPIQINIQSRQLNINSYIVNLDRYIDQIENELLQVQAVEYKRFISSLTELANIMSKKFFIVVPFYLIEAKNIKSKKAGLLSGFKSILGSSGKGEAALASEQFDGYQAQLNQRADLVMSGLAGLGLKTRQLQAEELKTIFFKIYNG
ncbi:MAG: hypothetical protein COV31_01530 [Candidatus Yanofskybacteria bacterium CG10_big_fil_rev_8_21_14_0_10_46_23]|uniref:TraC-like domain-containing protein n=1 Tax=Candidatus Yanofskybacteria bacterium CG10_big_fil_rev_8_21_14_0_10_46_23 TaxID=1975098 RepID=A0A2H0R4G5_9BACT|nr:MAG: hypothetical protein COV31_01530 [Candidatus Yanofskybacteria bacterium CG10_big_fil_rev_8_21_14_0_10_46_23]